LAADDQINGTSGKGRRKEALLFEKRSKNFCEAVADYKATAVQKFFGSFFQKRTAFPWLKPRAP
jgi:hypothetical protein